MKTRASRRSPATVFLSGRWAYHAAAVAAWMVFPAPVTGAADAAAVDLSNAGIVEVTVFPDRAGVVRSGTVSLPAGRSLVRLKNLPWRMETDSIQVSATGPPATLGAVEVESEAEKPVETPELLAARQAVRRIKTQMAGLDGMEQTAAQLQAFLLALRATTSQHQAEKLGEGKVDVEGVAAIYAFIHGRLDELAEQRLDRQEQRKDLGRDLKVAQARLAAARPAGAIRRRTVTVEVHLSRAGRLNLRLQYVTAGASWRPSYRVSLHPESSEATLLSQAVIRQQTGSDWKDVTLHLSTASPVRGVSPPELAPVFLRPGERLQAHGGFARFSRSGRKDRKVIDSVSGKIRKSPSMELAGGTSPRILGRNEDAEAEVKASGADAAFVASGKAMADLDLSESGRTRPSPMLTFHVKGPSTVPADGRDHRVVLRESHLATEMGYVAVPSLNTSAFLVASTSAPDGAPLLAGSARVFLGGAYLGSFPLQETGPGARLKLPFGTDSRIEIHRFPVTPRKIDTLSGREHREMHGFRTTVANHRKVQSVVELRERMPVSRDDRIRVEMGRQSTPGWKEDEDHPGILYLKLDLAPGEKGEARLEYTIRYPSNILLSRSPQGG